MNEAKVILRLSQLHECQFCTASHLAIMQGPGISRDLSPEAPHPDREGLALEYAELITRDSNRFPGAFSTRLRAASSEPEIVELTFPIGFITMLNRFNNAFWSDTVMSSRM